MNSNNKILSYKKRKIKLHYGFLQRILTRVKNLHIQRYDIFMRDLFIIIALICFVVNIILAFPPFLEDLYREQLQEKITEFAYTLISISVIWYIVIFYGKERKRSEQCIEKVNKKNMRQKTNCQFMDMRKK